MKNSKSIYDTLKRAVTTIALFLSVNQILFAQASHKGLWVLREDMVSRQRIDTFLEDAEKLGFTDLFVQVRGRGDALYKSKFVEQSAFIADPSFDPLKYVCDEGHKRGLKIHAWFNTYVLYSNKSENPPDLHVLSIFPEWIEWDENTSNDWEKLQNMGNLNNFEGVYLSPLHPQVNRYLLVLLKELISEYNIDGLHLDYVRFQGPVYGYNPEGMKQFYDKYSVNPRLFLNGAPLWRDTQSYRLFRKLYDQYRRDAINELIKELSDYNRKLNLPVVLSAAVKASPVDARNNFYQDWAEWINKGWLDLAIPMNYSTRAKTFEDNIFDIKALVAEEMLSNVWMGIGIWNQSYAEFENKINISVSKDFPNFVIFSYNVIKADKNYSEKIRELNKRTGS